MTAVGAQTDAAAHCAEEVKAHDFAAYAATLFAPPPARRALLALHAFAGEVARVRDHVSQPLPGEIRLQWWADALAGAGHGGIEGHPVAAEMIHAIAAYGLPVDRLSRVIEGHRAALYDDAAPTLTALESHLDDISSSLVVLAAQICAPRLALPDDLAHHAGLAQGLVSVIVAVPAEAVRGRLALLPQDLLALNAVRVEEVLAGRITLALQAMLAYLAGEADTHLARARAAARSLPPDVRPALLPLAVTARTMERLRRVDYDPFQLAPPSRMAMLWTEWRAARRGI